MPSFPDMNLVSRDEAFGAEKRLGLSSGCSTAQESTGMMGSLLRSHSK